jgi:polyisoprenoid-binding protein YceI
MFKSSFLVIALGLFSTTAFAKAVPYQIDGNHTQVNFTYSHFGFSDITDRFMQVTGEFNLDTDDLTRSSINVTIPMEGLSTGVPKLDEHLKSPDFFDAAKFPTATFKSTKVEAAGDNKLKVSGDLTIHGVTKPAVLDVTVNKIGPHPMSKVASAGFDASATLLRSDFGVGNYAPGVSDQVKLQITMETHQAKP